MSDDALLYTVSKTCEVLGYSKPTVYRLLAKGELRGRKAGRKTLIEAASVREHAAALPPFQSKAAA